MRRRNPGERQAGARLLSIASAAWIHLLRVLGWMIRGTGTLYAALGLSLSAGLLLALLSIWLMAKLTEEVLEGGTTRFDESVLRWIESHSSPWWDAAALEVTVLGDMLIALVLAAAVAWILYIVREKRLALVVTTSVLGAALFVPLLKLLFNRPRPQVFAWVGDHPASPAYPSGHAAMATAVFVALAVVVHRLAGGTRNGALAVAAAVVLNFLVGLSRLYLGVHYPSDVLAGWAVAFTWVIFCAVVILGFPRRVPGEGPQSGQRDG